MHVLCPHCRNTIERAELPPAEDILCPSCGSSFRVEPGSTTGWTMAGSGTTVGRFEVLSEVGAGAFGTVYLARDPELNRTVALKVPRAGNLASAAERERFLREARSAAQLRHPSIVAIHEVGQHDGVPFLVSDFVRGVTLADVLSARRPAPPEAARLVAAVADALHYAHQCGVVHRDVKPSNIMLGDDGTPYLMDFGLARRDGGEATMMREGQVLGTPAYMSPEQARGEAHRVSGSSDVYSLGAVLYQLLTGELPFRGNTRMLLHQVLHDEPRPLCALDDKVPRDLETICLKAMAKSPGRRYASALEMAEDLRRFLDGRPIKARPVGRLERTWRRARRRPAAAALVAVSVAAVLSVLAVSLVYNEQLRRTNADLATAKEKADERTQEALKNLRAGQELVRDYVTTVVNDPRLRERDLEGLRKTLLSLPVSFYTRLGGQSGHDRQTREEKASASYALADITYSLGDSAEAAKHYRKALAVYEELARDFPAEPDYRAKQARMHNNLGVQYARLGRARLAEEAYGRALKIRQALVRDRPREADYREDLASTHHNLGILYSRSRRAAQAEEAYGEAIRLLEQVRREGRGSPHGHRAAFFLCTAHDGLGVLYTRTNRPREAGAAHDRAVELLGQLRQTDPADPQFRDLLVMCHTHRGTVYQETGNYPQAEASFRTGIELGEKLTADHPGVTEYQSSLAEALLQRGLLHTGTGRFDQAEQSLEKALTIRERLAERSPTPRCQAELASALDGLVSLGIATGRTAQTGPRLRRAIDLHKMLLKDGLAENTFEQRRSLTLGLNHLGLFYTATGQPEEANKTFREAIIQAEELLKDVSEAPRAHYNLGTIWLNLGSLHLGSRHYPRAEEAFQKAVALLEPLTRAYPGQGTYRLRLAMAYLKWGLVYQATQQPDRAVERMNKGRDLYAALSREHQDVPLYKKELALAHGALGVVYYFTKRLKESADNHARSRELLGELAAAYPKATAYRTALTVACNCLGAVHLKQGNWQRAAPVYRQARDLGEALHRESPLDPKPLTKLVLSLRCLGDIYSILTSEPDLAENVYRRLVEAGERLVALQPKKERYQLDLAESCRQAAGFYGKFRRIEQQGATLRREVEVRARLADAHPGVSTFAVGLARACIRLSRCLGSQGKENEALPWYARSITALEKLAPQETSPNSRARGLLVEAHMRRADGLGRLGRHTDVLKDWERVLELGNERARVVARMGRALARANLGDHAKAVAEVREVIAAPGLPSFLSYNAACVLARASMAAAQDLTLPRDKAAQEAERHAAGAVELLGKARAAGFFKGPAEVDLLKKDADLASLRLRPDYRKLLAELENRAAPR